MLAAIVGLSTQNRLLVVFFVLLVGAVGVRAANLLPIDAVPDVTNVQVQVLTTAPALGPLEVEQFVTAPIENVMGGLPRLEEVRSLSKFGLSAITLVFEEGTDTYFARQMVAERLADAREAIPEGYGSPEMGPISTGLGEIYQFEVKGEPMCAAGADDTDACYTPMELRTVLYWYVAYQLRSVEGVVEVNSFGGELKTYEVQVDPHRLVSRQISLGQVFEALEKNNANAGGAYIETAGEQLLIRGEGLVETIDDIKNIVVSTPSEGTPVLVGDLGNVTLAPMVRQGAVTRDGRGEIVIGIAMMLMGENSRTVAEGVKEKLAAVGPSLPPGVTIDTFYDRTELVARTIKTVVKNLIEGSVLVIAVLLLLLGNVRGGLLVATSIPLSMLCAFIGMNLLGLSGNLMSLGAIDFGLIVDGSVVVVESIVRRLAHERARGTDVDKHVAIGAGEVARPVAFAVAIITLVYLPILTLQGVEGKMFRPMALTVIFALVASLLIALTLMPAMATIVFRNGTDEKETFVLSLARRIYEPALDKVMQRPKRTLIGALVAFALSLLVVPFLGAEFVPTLDEGAFAIQAVRLPSISLEEAVRSTTRLEKTLVERFPDEASTVVSKTGRPEIATDPMGVDISDIFIILKPHDDWKKTHDKEELVAMMEEALRNELPGQQFSFSQPIELRTNELISGVRSDVAVSIYGDDLDRLKTTADAVVRVLNGVAGAADVKAEQVAGLPVLRVHVDRARIARYGINVADVLDAVKAMGGRAVGEVFEGRKRFTLQVRLAAEARTDKAAIAHLPIAAPDGTLIPLGQLASLEIEDGPAQVSRERASRRISVEANVRGRDLAGFVAEAQLKLADAKVVPDGYFVEWGGQFENLEAATGRLAVAVPLALVLIFMLLFMDYKAVKPALLIYMNVPFAVSGGVLALAIRGIPLSISAAVGFITLFGIAVLNGILLVSAFRRLERSGLDPFAAATAGAREQLRPVLMTGLVAMLGFVPMAIASSAGAEVQRPLATVAIGGLITSTMFSVFVLPTIYAWIFGTRSPRAVADSTSAEVTKPPRDTPPTGVAS